MIINSYAKLNLYLEVLLKRKDNYHSLVTLFERISLADKIGLKEIPGTKIRIISSSKEIPKNSSNLAYRAAKLLQDSLQINKGVEIKITKRIPVGSGMGGGSSNAAFVLLGLNKLWKLCLSRDELVVFARKLGSDCAFFIYDTAFAQGGAKGDEIKVLKSLSRHKFWHVLVVPRVMVSTPMIYRRWDKENLGLTSHNYNVNILTSALKRKDIALINKSLFNNLEPVTAKIYPELRIIREKLNLMGLQAVSMSGSGPTIFGIVASRKKALSIYRQLKKIKLWQVFLSRTV